MSIIQITRIIAPSSAMAGDEIPIQVNLQNNGNISYLATANGYVEGVNGTPIANFQFMWITIEPGGIPGLSISSAFIMPSQSVNVWLYSWYADEYGSWTLSETQKVTIAITAQQYLGKIIDKKIRVFSTDYAIPASFGAPLAGSYSATLRVTGRNDMSSYQTLGIQWVVSSSGQTIAQGTNWGWEIAPGSTIEIDSDSFTLLPGKTYSLALSLLSTDGHVLDSYSGTLCTVAQAEIPPGAASFDYLAPTTINTTVLGNTVSISLPIKNVSGRVVVVTPKVTMYEGSVLGSPGSQIGSQKTLANISFTSGQTKPVTFSWVVAGALDRKDVILELYEGSTFISSNHYDDIIRTVTSGGVPPPGGECSIDADCPEGYICQDGVCVEAKIPTPGANWLPILIGGGVLVAAVALGGKKPAGKKAKKK